jgi:hypothetical protein
VDIKSQKRFFILKDDSRAGREAQTMARARTEITPRPAREQTLRAASRRPRRALPGWRELLSDITAPRCVEMNRFKQMLASAKSWGSVLMRDYQILGALTAPKSMALPAAQPSAPSPAELDCKRSSHLHHRALNHSSTLAVHRAQ